MKKESLGKILLLSWKSTFTGNLWKWLIGSASTLFGLLLLGKNFFNTTVENSIYIGISILLIIFLIRYLLFFSINVIQLIHYTYKESVYGDAIILLRDSFSKIHSLRKFDQIEDKDFIETMVIFCNNLKVIFDKKTKNKCSVSIKVPVKGHVNESTKVINLCRDSVATKIRDTNDYQKLNHTIIGNTAYQKILNNILKENKEQLYYLNNNISFSADYENTSKDSYENGKLPYESELVYPLIPHLWDSKSKNFECIGFICIDCNTKDVFDEKYDVAIISGVADGIYDTITLRNNQKIN
ncbi:hypothetical protein [Flavobacterium sp. DSP2-3-1]|uniref:hypothetical protein n=1 Tax=Flavobacterium sp. DSP2-3-1 TaxID=2804620 RepID=UPI003CE7C520